MLTGGMVAEIKRLANGIANELQLDASRGMIQRIGLEEIRAMIDSIVGPTRSDVQEMLEEYTARCLELTQ